MSVGNGNYWSGTRHPWACLLFILPLLVFYETGLYLLGPVPADEMRNGADAWLRGFLQHVGVSPLYGAPVLLLALLFLWSVWRRADRPRDYLGLWVGMTVESVLFALGLLCLSQLLIPLLQTVGKLVETPTVRLTSMSTGPASAGGGTWEQIVGYVGAGIYEETLFRLLVFGGLMMLLPQVGLPRAAGLAIAAFASAVTFAGAHNLGPLGEPFQPVIFLFRTCAGLYFTWIYHMRGFGIAVGAHASYDVLVGLLMRSV